MSRLETDCIHDIDRRWCYDCNPPASPASNAEVWADAVSMVIPGDGEDPMSVDDVAAAAGLTRHQFNKAVAWMRENYPDLPLVSSPAGISFTMDEATVNAFRRSRARSAETTIRRMMRGAVLPYVQQTATNRQYRRMQRMTDSLLDEIAEFTNGLAS